MKLKEALAKFIEDHHARTTEEERANGQTWQRALIGAEGQSPEIDRLRATPWPKLHRLAADLGHQNAWTIYWERPYSPPRGRSI